MLNTPLQNTNNDASTSRSTGEEESPCSIALVAEHHLETSTQKITSVEEPGPSCISDGLDTGTPEVLHVNTRPHYSGLSIFAKIYVPCNLVSVADR